MKRQLHREPAPEQSVYAGRELVGTITRKGDRFIALDADGHKIGSFPKSKDAFTAILTRPRPNGGSGR